MLHAAVHIEHRGMLGGVALVVGECTTAGAGVVMLHVPRALPRHSQLSCMTCIVGRARRGNKLSANRAPRQGPFAPQRRSRGEGEGEGEGEGMPAPTQPARGRPHAGEQACRPCAVSPSWQPAIAAAPFPPPPVRPAAGNGGAGGRGGGGVATPARQAGLTNAPPATIPRARPHGAGARAA